MDVPPPARTVAYGPDPAQVYDVRMPTTSPWGATVVVVHGGFWKAEYDRSHAAAQAQAIAEEGYHVAVLEYRRTSMPGGGWPGTFEDVQAAVAAVLADGTLPDRVVLVGHSAGGHLVALIAAQPPDPRIVGVTSLAGVVSLAGNVDLALVAELGLGDGAAAAFMGGASPDDWVAADPAAQAPQVPVVLVHGDADDVVPLAVSESYRTRTGAGELRRIPGVGHFEVIEPDHPAFAHTLAAIADLTRG